MRSLLDGGAGSVLVTRADAEARAAVRRAADDAEEHPRARLAWVARSLPATCGRVTIVSGGTSDTPVVHEARVRAELLGAAVVVHEDAGVAGLHRLAPALEDLREADCVIVVAGQDAALASVVGGLVSAPVIGVPTSTGYGASFARRVGAALDAHLLRRGRGGGEHRRRLRRRHDRGAHRSRRGWRAMTRLLYVDCLAGVAGDMLLGALLDAGADEGAVRTALAGLGVPGLDLEVGGVSRHSIAARRVSVVSEEQHAERNWGDDTRADRRGQRASRAREGARAGGVRAAGRGRGPRPRHPAQEVHFHEVGAVDAIGDICGVAVALESLGIDEIVCSPLPLGRGFAKTAHGTLPLPAPAMLELLRGAPLLGVDLDAELVTPTGAALVAALASEFGPVPAMRLSSLGYGAGTRDLSELPNVVRVLVGEAAEGQGRAHDVSLIETNLDDLSPELVPDAVEACFAAGALDVWVTPTQMKKGRPGFVLSALARPDEEQAVAEAMLRETSTLGVRVAHRQALGAGAPLAHGRGGGAAGAREDRQPERARAEPGARARRLRAPWRRRRAAPHRRSGTRPWPPRRRNSSDDPGARGSDPRPGLRDRRLLRWRGLLARRGTRRACAWASARSPSPPSRPRWRRASSTARGRWPSTVGIAHETISTDELARDGYRRNDRFRCFLCKTELYDTLAAIARERGYAAVLSGANADDAGDWRPGLRAAAEHGVLHPLLEAGLTKHDVRALAERLGVPSASKPASPAWPRASPTARRSSRARCDGSTPPSAP